MHFKDNAAKSEERKKAFINVPWGLQAGPKNCWMNNLIPPTAGAAASGQEEKQPQGHNYHQKPENKLFNPDRLESQH